MSTNNTVDGRTASDPVKVKEMRRLLAQENGSQKVEQRFGSAARGSVEFQEAQRQRQAAQKARERQRERAMSEAKQRELSQDKAAEKDKVGADKAAPDTAKTAGREPDKKPTTREAMVAERTKARENERDTALTL